MKSYKIITLLFVYIVWTISVNFAPMGTSSSTLPWTREKAEHLARATLFYAGSGMIDSLYAAGSASAAVDILFPDAVGPDRTKYDAAINTFTSTGFNWDSQLNVTKLYQMKYVLDPYEAKRKLFSLFEDIYSSNQSSAISFKDVADEHELLYSKMFGNYQVLVKRLLNNNGMPGDYAEGTFLNLFNQENPRFPNENYARELMQLFMMGEYEPFKNKESNDTRNYEESDVRSLARILTGLMTDKMTHMTSYNANFHYTGSLQTFLTGALPMSYVPPFYSMSSGTIDPVLIAQPYNGNNGLTDNVIEYIFAKRSPQIALFLANRLYRFYINDTPTRGELDAIAAIILANNFEMLPSIKSMLALDLMYSESAMNSLKYKNPLELYVGTIKKFRWNNMTEMLNDANLSNVNILPRLNWSAYFPGSVFGRDGFDDSFKWNNTSIENGWMSITNSFVYQNSGTGVIDFRVLLGEYRKMLTNESIDVMTHDGNSYSGNLTIASASFTLGTTPIIQKTPLQTMSLQSVLEDTMIPDTKYSDMSVVNSGDNFSIPYVNDFFSSSITNMISIPENNWEAPISESLSPLLLESGTQQSPMTTDTMVSTGEIFSGVTTSLPILEDMPILNAASKNSIVPTGEVQVLQDQTGWTLAWDVSVTHIQEAIMSTGSLDTGALSLRTWGAEGSGTTGEVLQNIDPTPLAALASSQSVTLTTGRVAFPNFAIQTNSGNITIFSGSYNAQTKTLTVLSGSLNIGTGSYLVTSGVFTFTPDSYLIADMITPEKIYSIYEHSILDGRSLPNDVKSEVLKFISTDASGSLIPIAPTNTIYYNSMIRWILSFMMVQPEYVLLRGSSLPPSLDPTEQHLLDSVTGKLVFIELYGGNDYLSSIIPKDEYDVYKTLRTNASGTIAITGTWLVDIGNFYMNSALAYSSSGIPTFKDLYDQGYLKLFNRVGGYNHSQDHSAAANQISSFTDTAETDADGVFGHFINKEFNSSNTISLGARLPNVYRSGRFVNMGCLHSNIKRNTLGSISSK